MRKVSPLQGDTTQNHLSTNMMSLQDILRYFLICCQFWHLCMLPTVFYLFVSNI